MASRPPAAGLDCFTAITSLLDAPAGPSPYGTKRISYNEPAVAASASIIAMVFGGGVPTLVSLVGAVMGLMELGGVLRCLDPPGTFPQ